MTTETIIQNVTQISALLTLLIGAFALYFSYKAQKGLISGEFKQIILKSFIFLCLVLIAVAAMATYHFNGSELGKWTWVIGMFVALILSAYESKGIIAFGKSFLPLKKFVSDSKDRAKRKLPRKA